MKHYKIKNGNGQVQIITEKAYNLLGKNKKNVTILHESDKFGKKAGEVEAPVEKKVIAERVEKPETTPTPAKRRRNS